MTETKFDCFDRNSNLEIIRQIRNSEKISLDDYIEKVLIPLKKENPNFLNTLYKDISYVLEGLDNGSDNDLLFENGDLVIEDGDFKLTGYQTRLHDISIWLHQEFVSKTMESVKIGFLNITDKLEKAEQQLFKNDKLTTEYKSELDKIKKSLKKERKFNYDNKSNGLKKYLDFDILELKPNIFGLGINLNEIINKAKNKE
ncbi:hypothetical protein OS188_14510 [Xanthomarina sp. F1114]|uniref:hypothetical protein n=1 Tax=Xanthomarina sp. F1114 TaxID=2996019 RepID=UPI00225DDABD|nr:hypothetical protein [Xanthomarina sp. F1114]MCX7549166.1 hypothetical protein [Xanthomarina sp. F1114]